MSCLKLVRYRKSLTEVVNTAVHAAKFRGLFISFSIFALFGGIVGVSWYGALLVQSGAVKVGGLFSFILYTSFIAPPLPGLETSTANCNAPSAHQNDCLKSLPIR